MEVFRSSPSGAKLNPQYRDHKVILQLVPQVWSRPSGEKLTPKDRKWPSGVKYVRSQWLKWPPGVKLARWGEVGPQGWSWPPGWSRPSEMKSANRGEDPLNHSPRQLSVFTLGVKDGVKVDHYPQVATFMTVKATIGLISWRRDLNSRSETSLAAARLTRGRFLSQYQVQKIFNLFNCRFRTCLVKTSFINLRTGVWVTLR
jgi:hypothetical protein